MRLATGLAATALAVTTTVHAQQNAPLTASVPESTKAAAERRPYEDRIMEGMPSQDEADLAAAEYSQQGWPRGITLQLTRNLQSSRNISASAGYTRTKTQGVQIDAFVETPNYGALSLSALALGGGNATGLTSWSLRQTGLPFDGGWRVDNALGTTNILVPELARRNSRLVLPATQVLGGSTIWRNEGSNALVLGASVGEPGRYEGFPQSRFVGLGGQVNSLFALATEGKWTAAAAVAQGSEILPEVAPIAGDAARISTRGFYVSAEQTDVTAGTSLQASAIGSRTSDSDATGIWGDATWRDGGHNHQVSIFRFAPGLTWIDRPLAADLQGGSYRYDYRSLRWDLSANIESFASVSGQNPSGWYTSTSGRRLLTAGVSIGGGFAFRSFGVSSGSGFGYLEWRNPLGISRLQLDAASTQGGQSSHAVTLDHSIYAENGMSLSTSLSLERLQPVASSIEAQPPREHAAALGLNGRILLTNRIALQGSLRARNVTGAGADSGTTLAANVGLDWQISQDWSLGASFYENRGVLTDTVAVQSPLVVPEIIRARPSDRGFFLVLRYGSYAGTPSAPLGGLPGSGAGRIEGSVFLDSNGNGQRDGNESGAANVLVTLDGRFSTRTNAFGAFEFSNIVSGPHTLSVLQDDLPLPWTVDTDQKITAPVSTRGTTHVDIGAKRMR
jgi:hypothetical protein